MDEPCHVSPTAQRWRHDDVIARVLHGECVVDRLYVGRHQERRAVIPSRIGGAGEHRRSGKEKAAVRITVLSVMRAAQAAGLCPQGEVSREAPAFASTVRR